MSSPYRIGGYRSRFEYRIAKDLELRGLDFDYEPQRFSYTSHHFYTPDFRLSGADFVVEAKGGSWGSTDRAKYLKCADQNQDLDLRFLFYDDRPIGRTSSTLNSQWCERHGFKYAFGPSIPDEWLS